MSRLLVSSTLGDMQRLVRYIVSTDNAQVTHRCYKIIRNTCECLERVYYKYVLRPSAIEVIHQQTMAACVICILYSLRERSCYEKPNIYEEMS